MASSTVKKACRYLMTGAGAQGRAIGHDLLRDEETTLITYVDERGEALVRVEQELNDARVHVIQADVNDRATMARLMLQHDVAIGATSFSANPLLTELAIEAGVHWIDLGGNDAVVAAQFKMHAEAQRRGVRVLPAFGIGPGADSVLAAYALTLIQDPTELFLYVGGLPIVWDNELQYAELFALLGLLNEILEDVEVVDNYARVIKESMTELHVVDGFSCGPLEAVLTSGGVATLTRNLAGTLKTVRYFTLRPPETHEYTSHWKMMRALRNMGMFSKKPLKLREGSEVIPFEVMLAMLDKYLPKGVPDKLYLRIVAKNEAGQQILLTLEDQYDLATAHTAMQRTTGYSVAIAARMLLDASIPGTGVLCHETFIPAPRFLQEWSYRGINVHVTHVDAPTHEPL